MERRASASMACWSAAVRTSVAVAAGCAVAGGCPVETVSLPLRPKMRAALIASATVPPSRPAPARSRRFSSDSGGGGGSAAGARRVCLLRGGGCDISLGRSGQRSVRWCGRRGKAPNLSIVAVIDDASGARGDVALAVFDQDVVCGNGVPLGAAEDGPAQEPRASLADQQCVAQSGVDGGRYELHAGDLD